MLYINQKIGDIALLYVIHSNHLQCIVCTKRHDGSPWPKCMRQVTFNCLRSPCSCRNVIDTALCCLLSPITPLQFALQHGNKKLQAQGRFVHCGWCRMEVLCKRLWHGNRWRLLTNALQGHSLLVWTGGAAWRNSEERQQDEQHIANRWSRLCGLYSRIRQ